jgi:hypothetical protein
MLEVLEVLEVN